MPSSYIISGEATSINNITGLGAGIVAGDLARPLFATTATAAGTTTLTVTSAATQEFTGSTTQTVTNPVVTTLVAGWATTFINKSTGNVTLNSSGGNAIVVLAAGQSVTLVCKSVSADTTAAAWDVVGPTLRSYTGSASPTSLTISPYNGPTSIAITVTGAAAGDTASVTLPAPSQGNPVVSYVVVTTNTVTVYITNVPDDIAVPADATWATGSIIAQIIK